MEDNRLLCDILGCSDAEKIAKLEAQVVIAWEMAEFIFNNCALPPELIDMANRLCHAAGGD